MCDLPNQVGHSKVEMVQQSGQEFYQINYRLRAWTAIVSEFICKAIVGSAGMKYFLSSRGKKTSYKIKI